LVVIWFHSLKLSSFFITVAWLLLVASNPCFAQSEADYENQLQSLTKTIEQLQKELRKTKSSRDKLQRSLQESEEEISTLQSRILEIKEALDREKKQLTQLQGRRSELEALQERQRQKINRIVRQAYALGQESKIKLLLNQEAPYRVTRLLRYHDYIVSAHKQKLQSYLDTLNNIAFVESNIAVTLKNLEVNRARLNQRFQDLKDSQVRRLQTLANINSELTNKGGSLDQLQVDREKLERLLEEATRALSQLKLPGDVDAFHKARGQLPYPANGRIAFSYGSPRHSGKMRWQGLFIVGKAGSDVVSVHYGRVIFSDYLRGHGLLLIIDHGDSYMSLYAHNQILLKETGEWASRGEPVAKLGNTGGQSRAGLYFEIRHEGKPQNPKPWLKYN
jgi:septal ring factor EnvC (AmiA/AmiB activator)